MQQAKMKLQQENKLLRQQLADMTNEKADMEKKKGQFVENLERENNLLKNEKEHYKRESTKSQATIELLKKRIKELEQKVEKSGHCSSTLWFQGRRKRCGW